jgi:hypothetical protein
MLVTLSNLFPSNCLWFYGFMWLGPLGDSHAPTHHIDPTDKLGYLTLRPKVQGEILLQPEAASKLE